MKLEVRRLDKNGRYETIITRDDHVSFRVAGVAHTCVIPHDLAHYIIEKGLGLEDGFWGSVAAGAIFASMTYVSGRRKPKASERSKTLLKTNAQGLSDAEIAVSVLNRMIEQGHGDNFSYVSAHLREHLPPGKTLISIRASAIAAIHASYKETRQVWETLPVGSVLVRHW